MTQLLEPSDTELTGMSAALPLLLGVKRTAPVANRSPSTRSREFCKDRDPKELSSGEAARA